MELEQIHNEWEVDSKIDKSDLSMESLKIPSLHHKYWKILTNERLVLKKYESELISFKKLKAEYYSGKLNGTDELKELKWEPNKLRILKEDLGLYINSDQDVRNKVLRIALQEEKIELLQDIIKSIHGRAWVIKSSIDFLKFTNGQ